MSDRCPRVLRLDIPSGLSWAALTGTGAVGGSASRPPAGQNGQSAGYPCAPPQPSEAGQPHLCTRAALAHARQCACPAQSARTSSLGAHATRHPPARAQSRRARHSAIPRSTRRCAAAFARGGDAPLHSFPVRHSTSGVPAYFSAQRHFCGSDATHSQEGAKLCRHVFVPSVCCAACP